jgi:hypothetical protein
VTVARGVGVINIHDLRAQRPVVGFAYVQAGDELLVITQQGMILRMLTDDVRVDRRATQGVTIIDLEETTGRLDRAAVEKEGKSEGETGHGGTDAGRNARRRRCAVALVAAAGCCAPAERSIAQPVLRGIAPARPHGAAEMPPSSFEPATTASSPASTSPRVTSRAAAGCESKASRYRRRCGCRTARRSQKTLVVTMERARRDHGSSAG